MMAIQVDPRCLYTKTHEWVRVEGEFAYTGITDYAQQQLSDIVYVELPEVGDRFEKGEVFCTVESVKAASDCYLAAGGEIIEVNEALVEHPELVNQDPYGEGWLVRFRLDNPADLGDLMAPNDYSAYAAEQEEAHT